MDENQITADEPPTPAALHTLYLELRDEVSGLKDELAANTLATNQVQTNTSDLVELFANARGAFKVLEGIGKAAKPLMYIASLCGALLTAYGAWKANR